MPNVTVRALGNPVPQGSLAYKGTRGGRAVLISDNAGTLKPWRATIAAATQEALGAAWEPLDEPVRLTLLAVVKRPQRPRWSVPATKPDLDKLARAILDGLADGGLYVNDSRVYDLSVRSEYEGELPMGVVILAEWGSVLALEGARDGGP